MTVGRHPRRTWLGFGLLFVTAALLIVLPVTIPTILVGALATGVLAFDRRFGPLPAALLVMLALPYDRAADLYLPEVAGVPFRVQDGVVATGIVLAMLRISGLRARLATADGRLLALSAVVGLFLVLGLVALWIGWLADHAARDIFRDARWWVLYAVVLLALATGTRWPLIVRAALVGTTIFAAVIVLAALLPPFENGLKARAFDFDRGLLRMQFGNSAFLLVGLAYATRAVLRRPDWGRWAWLLLLVTAGGLSLTRTFILVAAGVVGLVVVVWLAGRARQARAGDPRLRVASVITAVVVGFVVAIGTTFAGVRITGRTVAATPAPVASPASSAAPSASPAPVRPAPTPIEDPVERLLFQGPNSDINSLSRRFAAYGRAVDIIVARPILGSGLGQLVAVDYEFGRVEFDTPGFLPNVDDAYLTVGMKAGLVGMIVFAAMLLLPLLTLVRHRARQLGGWFLPAWIGILGLTLTQSFATTGYGPFAVGLLLVVPSLAYASRRPSRARAQA